MAYFGVKGTNNKWTYNLIDHWMKNIEIMVSLASMTYVVDLDAYELHPGDEKCLTTLLMNARVLYYTYDRGSLLFKHIFAYSC